MLVVHGVIPSVSGIRAVALRREACRSGAGLELEEAERLYRVSLEGRKKVLGEMHRDTLTGMHALAKLLDYSSGALLSSSLVSLSPS